METSTCRLCGFNISGARAVFSTYACHLFFSMSWPLFPYGGVPVWCLIPSLEFFMAVVAHACPQSTRWE